MLSTIGTLFLVFSLALLLRFVHQWHYGYWCRRKLSYIPTRPIVGNVYELIRGFCCFGEQFKSLYNDLRAKDQSIVGIHVLFNRALLARDPELIKHILVKDFSSFSNRFETTDANGDSMGSLNLFFAKYKDWKEMHSIFTPFFAASNVKLMYPLMTEIALRLETNLKKRYSNKPNGMEIEVKELCALFTTDVITSLAFGIEANSLSNQNAEFRRMCIEVNDPRPKRLFHLFVMFFFPSLTNFVGTHLYSPEYEKFMRNAMSFVMEERQKSGVKRGDLIDAFIELIHDETLHKNSVVHRKDFFVAHAAFLLLAGFDTSSSTITFALHELSQHPDIQEKVRTEMHEVIRDNKDVVSYEMLSKMKFLDCVVKEVLRLYPPTAFLDRCCGLEQGYDLKPYVNYKIPKGMPVYISVMGLHHDEKYWTNPLSFMPERFLPGSVVNHTPMTYLPFGAGPRGCIGSLLGMLQVKLGLIYILKNFFVKPCKQTKRNIEFDPKAFVLTAKGGTHLKFIEKKLK